MTDNKLPTRSVWTFLSLFGACKVECDTKMFEGHAQTTCTQVQCSKLLKHLKPPNKEVCGLTPSMKHQAQTNNDQNQQIEKWHKNTAKWKFHLHHQNVETKFRFCKGEQHLPNQFAFSPWHFTLGCIASGCFAHLCLSCTHVLWWIASTLPQWNPLPNAKCQISNTCCLMSCDENFQFQMPNSMNTTVTRWRKDKMALQMLLKCALTFCEWAFAHKPWLFLFEKFSVERNRCFLAMCNSKMMWIWTNKQLGSTRVVGMSGSLLLWRHSTSCENRSLVSIHRSDNTKSLRHPLCCCSCGCYYVASYCPRLFPSLAHLLRQPWR